MDRPESELTDNERKHQFLRWNPEIQQWFCIACGRTSDHAALADAKIEIEQHDCKMPSVEVSNAMYDGH